MAELAGPWQARRESDLRARRGRDRLRAAGAGRGQDLAFTGRVLVTLAVLRLQIPHAALAVMYGVHRMHDQTALRTDGIDHLLEQFPDVRAEMDAGYRGLHRDHPDQVSVPPKRPAKGAAPEAMAAWEQARHAQSSARICVEHAIAGSKHWRPLQRWIGRREDLAETVQAIGSLVSDRAAAW